MLGKGRVGRRVGRVMGRVRIVAAVVAAMVNEVSIDGEAVPHQLSMGQRSRWS